MRCPGTDTDTPGRHRRSGPNRPVPQRLPRLDGARCRCRPPVHPGHEYTGIVRAAPSVPISSAAASPSPSVIACGDCPGASTATARSAGSSASPASPTRIVRGIRSRATGPVNLVPSRWNRRRRRSQPGLPVRRTAWRALTRSPGSPPGDTVVVFGAGVSWPRGDHDRRDGTPRSWWPTSTMRRSRSPTGSAHAVPVGARHRPADIAERSRNPPRRSLDRGRCRRQQAAWRQPASYPFAAAGRHVQVGLPNAPTTALPSPISSLANRPSRFGHGNGGLGLPRRCSRGSRRAHFSPQLLVTGTVRRRAANARRDGQRQPAERHTARGSGNR